MKMRLLSPRRVVATFYLIIVCSPFLCASAALAEPEPFLCSSRDHASADTNKHIDPVSVACHPEPMKTIGTS